MNGNNELKHSVSPSEAAKVPEKVSFKLQGLVLKPRQRHSNNFFGDYGK